MAISTPILVVPALAAAAIATVGAVAVAGHGHNVPQRTVPARPVTSSPARMTPTGDVARLQQHLRQVPRDWQAWASLGLDYVQQARTTVDPTYYPKADAALSRSLSLDTGDNIVAMAGEAALAAARHDFRSALTWARRGLRIDPDSGVLYGALDDALTQLGDYRGAAQAAVRMEELSPGTAAEARLSYAAELRGDVRAATQFMQLALRDAGSPADVAFARYYLGDLAFNAGDARVALRHYDAGLAADPTYVALREGRARAEAARGDTNGALRDYALVVREVPQPAWLAAYGELLQSRGERAGATAEYDLVRTEERLFTANGVALDSDATLFEADHGDADVAVAIGRRAIRSRPFLDSYDAYAWALHRAGHDRDALAMSNRALASGVRNALFFYHRGAIQLALGDNPSARRDLTAAVAINPSFNPLAAPLARHLLRTLS